MFRGWVEGFELFATPCSYGMKIWTESIQGYYRNTFLHSVVWSLARQRQEILAAQNMKAIYSSGLLDADPGRP